MAYGVVRPFVAAICTMAMGFAAWLGLAWWLAVGFPINPPQIPVCLDSRQLLLYTLQGLPFPSSRGTGCQVITKSLHESLVSTRSPSCQSHAKVSSNRHAIYMYSESP
ncbi:hypothetical protein V8C37DRAFT_369767 [Trichoderma ceciliae]